jgi:hypothetical protein
LSEFLFPGFYPGSPMQNPSTALGVFSLRIKNPPSAPEGQGWCLSELLFPGFHPGSPLQNPSTALRVFSVTIKKPVVKTGFWDSIRSSINWQLL